MANIVFKRKIYDKMLAWKQERQGKSALLIKGARRIGHTENIIYDKLLSDKLSSDLGYVYKNLVAQMLTASGNKLYYYTFPHATSHKNYEIDFLFSRGKKFVQ